MRSESVQCADGPVTPAPPGPVLDIRLLGPVRANVGTRQLDLGPRKQRLVFAVLALEAGRVVPVDRLVDLAWPVNAPRTAAHAVRVCVSALRSVLADSPDAGIETSGAGYALRVPPERVDAVRFRRLLREAAGTDDDAAKVCLLDAALGLWTGAVTFGVALSGTASAPTRELLCRGLEESRLTALEDRLDAELRRGRHAAVLAEVTDLAYGHPTRERLTGQLMLCLYRAGRPGDALEAFHRLRMQLADEFGVDPGPAVRALQLAVLRDDPALRSGPGGGDVVRRPPPPARLPAQLPAVTGGFVGREAEVDRLDALLPDGPVTSVVISGMAGVGKTALAVRWAHRVRAEFPDGQLYVNLGGGAPGPPLRPSRALTGFLTALGVPGEAIPVDETAAAALYRTTVADRRILVVLDDAAGPEQVRPLLPGGAGCRVVITSRHRLGGLAARDGARLLELGVLTGAESERLLTGLTGAAGPTHRRVAQLCAHLPLALRIAAVRLAAEPAGYLGRLEAANRLAALEIDDDREAAVRAAFDLSYAALPPAVRRIFRLLGLVPGADIDRAGVAALSDVDGATAAAALAALTDANLLENPAPGRYRLHDLLRLYAAEQACRHDRTPDRAAAVDRLNDFYLRCAAAAATLAAPTTLRLPVPSTSSASADPPLTDATAAGRWLDVERANLISAVLAAARSHRHATAYLLGDVLAGYFWTRRGVADWLIVAHAGVRAATAAGDRRAQAASRRHLAGVYLVSGRSRDAVTELGTALDLARAAGWREGQAGVLNSRALAAQNLGDSDRADADLVEALALFRQAGLVPGESTALTNLGRLYGRIGRLRAAVQMFTQALEIDRRLGSAVGVGVCLGNLGGAYWRLGRLPAAVEHLHAGLAAHLRSGHRPGTANTHMYLARVHHDRGHDDEATAAAELAVATAGEVGDPVIEVDARNILADCLLVQGRRSESADVRREAVALAEGSGYRFGTAEALIGLATADIDAGRPGSAIDHARGALRIAAAGRYRVLAGHAHAALAVAHRDAGDTAAARADARQAVDLHRRTGHLAGEARAARLLGTLAPARSAEAAAWERRVRTLRSELGCDGVGDG